MITIDSISKKYKNFYAVKDVTMNLVPGEVYGLVGKNGAGKSTLFKLILGLTVPYEGTVSVGNSKSQKELDTARKSIGFYMGPSFYPYLNAKDNLKYVARMKNIKDPNEVDRVLALVDLDGVKKPFKSFSLGMKQRLGIANALLGDPQIVLLDEPINGLDPQGILEIRDIIKNLGKVHQKTVIVSSHILSELELVADRFGIIDHGILLKEFDHSMNDDEHFLHLRTNQDDSAMSLLSELNPSMSDDGLLINVEFLANEYIQILINNHIQILEITVQKQKLEQQYFALTGGK